jgi:hypothetical protein
MEPDNRRIFIIAVLVVVGLSILACGIQGNGEAEEVTVTPSATSPFREFVIPPEDNCGDGICDEEEQADPALCPEDCVPKARGWCGDGICDEAEQKNPDLCPQDCQGNEVTVTPSPQPVFIPGGIGCTPGDWLLVVHGCVHETGTEPSADLCSDFKVCFTVDEQCQIQGSDEGQYDQDTCFYTSPDGCMTYDVSCPDFPISVSGQQITDTMRIMVDASQIWEKVVAHEICVGPIDFPESPGAIMQLAFGSAVRNGGGIFCEIEARDGAHVDLSGVDAFSPGNLSYSFSIDLFEDCQGH